jgi:hypothetical protein
MDPFLQRIGQKKEMLLELHTAKAEPEKSPDLKDEQRKCRMRTLLPRFEKKAYLMVVEFREVNGRNFEWDVELCITGLAHIMLSEVEPKAIRARARKRST